MTDIYVLLTSRVPFPRGQAFFALLLLTFYSLASLMAPQLAALGFHPIILAFLATFTTNLWLRTPRILGDNDPDIAWSVMFTMLAICAAIIFFPDLIWLQRMYSLGLVFVMGGFLALYLSDGPDSFPWFAQNWRCGQRNAANWHIARYAALLACNEAIIRTATPNEWIISIAVLPIVMYYLMYWTILATHPYEDDPAPHDP